MINSPAFKALPLLVAAIFLVHQAVQQMKMDLVYQDARTELGFWGRGNYQPVPATVHSTGRAIENLLRVNPAHPDFLGLRAGHASWLAHWATDPRARQRYGEQALQSQHRAVVSRPAHRSSWSKLERYAARMEGGQTLLLAARGRIEALTPVPHKAQL